MVFLRVPMSALHVTGLRSQEAVQLREDRRCKAQTRRAPPRWQAEWPAPALAESTTARQTRFLVRPAYSFVASAPFWRRTSRCFEGARLARVAHAPSLGRESFDGHVEAFALGFRVWISLDVGCLALTVCANLAGSSCVPERLRRSRRLGAL